MGKKGKRKLYLFGYPIVEYVPILSFFFIIGAISIIIYAIDEDNILAQGASLFLSITFFIYHYSNTEDKRDKDNEIANLKAEIYKLKELSEGDKKYIKILEEKLGIHNN